MKNYEYEQNKIMKVQSRCFEECRKDKKAFKGVKRAIRWLMMRFAFGYSGKWSVYYVAV